MPTLLSAHDRTAIVARLRRVTRDRAPRWGTLTAPRMLCHVTDQLRIATGIIIGRHRDSLVRRTVMKWIVVNSPLQAPPGKVQTVPEMLSTAPTTWAADMATCERLIAEVGLGKANGRHPAFGPLNGKEWGRIAWKHFDHHLRQFGE
jgi:Protein of unknown function (DUF1569)